MPSPAKSIDTARRAAADRGDSGGVRPVRAARRRRPAAWIAAARGDIGAAPVLTVRECWKVLPVVGGATSPFSCGARRRGGGNTRGGDEGGGTARWMVPGGDTCKTHVTQRAEG